MNANVQDYELVAPPDLPGALDLLSESPGKWTLLAGGTDLMVLLNAGKLECRHLVSVHRLEELKGIRVSEDEIRLGAACSYSDLRRHPVIRQELPLLDLAAGWTGSLANQNRGTLGGNIVNASPAADSPPALLAYDAELELTSKGGTRRVPYSDFHTGYKQTVLEPAEILTSIVLPRRLRPGVHYLRKVGARKAQAIAKVALAGYGELANGVVIEIRIAAGSVAPVPLRCTRTEQFLIGRSLSDAVITDAGEILAEEISPIDDIRSTRDYRKRVTQNLLREFLEQLSGGGQ